MTKEEELGIGKAGRKVDMKEEYYVSLIIWSPRAWLGANMFAETSSEGFG